MEAACAPRAFLSLAPASKTRIPAMPAQFRRCIRGGSGGVRTLRSAVKRGGSGGPATESGRKLEEELAGMRILGRRENCEDANGGGGGVVELLECLEREAIMGEDEGRQPSDYNRRAQIFDTSSRIFQALKNDAIPGDDDDPSPEQGGAKYEDGKQ